MVQRILVFGWKGDEVDGFYLGHLIDDVLISRFMCGADVK